MCRRLKNTPPTAEVRHHGEPGLVVADFSKRMPEGIKASAVVHLDESHVHMHILVINLDDPKLDANKLHIGKRKATEVRETHDDRLPALPQPELLPKPLKPKAPKPSRTPKTQAKRQADYKEALANWERAKKDVAAANETTLAAWKEANREQCQRERGKVGKPKATQAYNAAMTQLQDDYHEAVGKPCGLLRDGPKAQRLSTVEYDRAKKQAKKAIEAKAALSKLEAAKWDAEVLLAATQAEQEAERARTSAAMQDLERLREAQEAKERELADREATLAVDLESHREASEALALLSLEATEKAAKLNVQEESLAQREAQLAIRIGQLDERESVIDQKTKEMLAEMASTEDALRQREADLAARDAQAQQRASQLDQRQATFEASLAKAKQSIAAERAANQTQANQLTEREAALAAKERAIEAAQEEIEEVTQGMEALMNAVENEEVDLVTEPQATTGLHKAFLRLVMTQPEKRSPLQRLLGRFVSFLKRGQSVDGGPSYGQTNFSASDPQAP